jgi:eukaryotic-like serine/threonine-protein kinase
VTWWVVNMRKLASGGMADVYVGQRNDTWEWVVVKYLRDAHLLENRKYFAREVRILTKRVHAGVVSILSWNLDAPVPWYVMPYFPGGKLTAWAGRLTQAQLTNIAIEMAVTLNAMHSQAIAHGDFKPDNILLTQQGRLRIGDPLGNGAGCTVVWRANRGGTPGYWAPEIARGGVISPAGDVFSFGATLYQMATGCQPVDGQMLDPLMVGTVVPAAFRALILRCCAPDWRLRPSASQIVAMLRNGGVATIRAAPVARPALAQSATRRVLPQAQPAAARLTAAQLKAFANARRPAAPAVKLTAARLLEWSMHQEEQERRAVRQYAELMRMRFAAMKKAT